METRAGVKLTKEEVDAIKSLQRAAKKFKKATDRLWLYSASGTLTVMMRKCDTNPTPEHTEFGGVNPYNYITEIDIPNDSGDW